MTDDLHPETTLAKIRRGDLSPLRNAEILPPEQLSRQEPNEAYLTEQLHKISEVDVSKNRIATWWNKGQVKQLTELLGYKVLAAQQTRILQGFEADRIRGQAAHEVERYLFQNQVQVAIEATNLGMPIDVYATYVLEKAKAEIEIQKERMSLEETFKLAITEATTIFRYQHALIAQIAEIDEALENLPKRFDTPAKIKSARQNYAALKRAKQGELRASQSESFLQNNRQKTRRPEKDQTKPEGLSEQD
ncbi:MAG TPA: hypothetical protein VIJ93_04010 [bacterium]